MLNMAIGHGQNGHDCHGGFGAIEHQRASAEAGQDQECVHHQVSALRPGTRINHGGDIKTIPHSIDARSDRSLSCSVALLMRM